MGDRARPAHPAGRGVSHRPVSPSPEPGACARCNVNHAQGLLVPLFALCAMALPASAQLSGATYTTDANGVAKDSFAAGPDVWLAGGPSPSVGCGGNGLADGLYFFQVTDPAGATLLSGDRIEDRVVRVVNGVFESASSAHAVANGPCSSKIVQLEPFDRAPAGSGEYKVWLTPVAEHVPGGPNFGFLSDKSKTDFFQISSGPPVQEVVIEGTVYFDFDEDGEYDGAGSVDVPIPGWRVEIDGLGVTFSDEDGHYEFIRDEGTSHVLDSIAPTPGYVGVPGGLWASTSPIAVDVVAVAPSVTVDFGLLFMINTPQFATSKEFWQGTGEPLLAASGQEWRRVVNALCLRLNKTVPFPPPDPDPTLFEVPEQGSFDDAYDALVRYLAAPSLHVAANVLSKEVAAANLNTSVGPLADKQVYIDRDGNSVLLPFELVSAEAVALLCDPKSCDTGPTGDPVWIEEILAALGSWIGMNSSGKNIYTRDSTFPAFVSPY